MILFSDFLGFVIISDYFFVIILWKIKEDSSSKGYNIFNILHILLKN